jgi:hypothetical protein
LLPRNPMMLLRKKWATRNRKPVRIRVRRKKLVQTATSARVKLASDQANSLLARGGRNCAKSSDQSILWE